MPLVVRTPWTTANGTVNHAPVLNIDFASTIAQLPGVTPAIRRTATASHRCSAGGGFRGVGST